MGTINDQSKFKNHHCNSVIVSFLIHFKVGSRVLKFHEKKKKFLFLSQDKERGMIYTAIEF